MKKNEQIDGRDLRDGDWFWTQKALLYVFTPLIGTEASWLYVVLCNMIPDKVNNPLIEMTVRSIQRGSGLSIGTVHRKLKVLTAIGMIEVIGGGNRETPIYKLINLKKLAGLGTEELKRRLSVPRGNTGEGVPDLVPPSDAAKDEAEGRADGVDAMEAEAELDSGVLDRPASTDESSVPGGNSDSKSPDGGKKPEEMSFSEFALFQKGGGSVPKKGGFCSSESDPFNSINLSNLKTSPVVPSQARGRLPAIAASVDDSDSGKKQKQKTSHEAKGKGKGGEDLLAAVAKVKRECGLSMRRIGETIERAMRLEASAIDLEPDWNAIGERMISRYKRFLENQNFMSYKVLATRFFAELWDDDRKWPWDEKLLRELRDRRV
jgi:DNA-binding transcriptional ArsR family regulator